MDGFMDHLSDILLTLFPYTAAALGLFALGMEVRIEIRGRQYRKWPVVTGVILRSRVAREAETRSSPGGDTAQVRSSRTLIYFPEISYQYTVDGKTYENDIIGLSSLSVSHPDRAQKLVDRFPEGGRVPVYYRPGDPSDSLLDPEYNPGKFLFLCLGAVFTLTGLIWIFCRHII